MESLGSAKRAQEARGWGPGAGCAKAEGTPGCFAGLTMARRREVSHSRAGGAAEPPPPSGRSVSPGLAAGQLAPRPRLSPLARQPRPRGPRQGGPRRPPAPPRPARDPSRDAPPTLATSLASAPLAVCCQPAPPPPRTAQLRTPWVSRVFFALRDQFSLCSGRCRGPA